VACGKLSSYVYIGPREKLAEFVPPAGVEQVSVSENQVLPPFRSAWCASARYRYTAILNEPVASI